MFLPFSHEHMGQKGVKQACEKGRGADLKQGSLLPRRKKKEDKRDKWWDTCLSYGKFVRQHFISKASGYMIARWADPFSQVCGDLSHIQQAGASL
jgi:hypothetical protein